MRHLAAFRAIILAIAFLAIVALATLAGFTVLPVLGQQPDAGSNVGNIVRSDPALDKLVPPGAKIEKLHDGFRFIEGPIWVRSGGYLLFSDLQVNAIMKWTPDGSVSFSASTYLQAAIPMACNRKQRPDAR